MQRSHTWYGFGCVVWRTSGRPGAVVWLAIKRLGVTKQDGGRLNGHHCEPAITRKRQRFSKIHESNRNIFTWRSRSCLSCGIEVNAVPDDRMTQNNYRNPSCRGLIIDTITEKMSIENGSVRQQWVGGGREEGSEMWEEVMTAEEWGRDVHDTSWRWSYP